MKKQYQKLFFLFYIFSVNNLIYSQNIKGKVFDKYKEPIPFVNIYITKIIDTTKIINGTVSDFQGNFILKTHKTKPPIYLFANYLGYQIKKIKLDSIPNKIIYLELKEVKNKLSEIVIKTKKSVQNYANKTVYNIKKSDVKHSSTGIDVLKVVPELLIDENDNTIQNIQRKSVLILINGMYSSTIEVKSLNPNDIEKIEYYDIPTARYQNMGVSSVLNVITKKNINGGNIMIDARQSIPFYSVGDYLISGRYSHKNSLINLFYNYSTRNYTKKKYYLNKVYKINNTINKEITESFLFPFGYGMHNLKTSYNYIKSNNIFHIGLNVNYTNSYNKPKYIFERSDYTNQISGIGKSNYYNLDLTSRLNVYFQKKLKNNKQLTFDIVGQISNIDSDYNKNEKDNNNTLILEDFSYDKNKKKSIITEVVYDFNINNINVETGIKYKYGILFQNTKNKFSEGQFELNKQESNVYLSATGKFKKINYSLGVNNKYSFFKGIKSEYKKNNITGNLNISYPLSKSSNILFKYQNNLHTPSLSILNEQQFFLAPNFIQKGNANLKPYNTNSFAFNYYYNKSNSYFMLRAGYEFSIHPVFTHYYLENNQLISSYFNGKKSYSKYVAFFLKKMFFSKKLSLSSYISFFEFKNDFTINNTLSLSGIYYNFILSFYYKKFIINVKFENPYKKLDDYTIHQVNVNSDINVFYKKNNLKFGMGVYLPFEESYMNYYISKSPLYHDISKVDIFDSANYFYVRLNYNLSFGKQLKFNKKISNSDDDKGTIKH